MAKAIINGRKDLFVNDGISIGDQIKMEGKPHVVKTKATIVETGEVELTVEPVMEIKTIETPQIRSGTGTEQQPKSKRSGKTAKRSRS